MLGLWGLVLVMYAAMGSGCRRLLGRGDTASDYIIIIIYRAVCTARWRLGFGRFEG